MRILQPILLLLPLLAVQGRQTASAPAKGFHFRFPDGKVREARVVGLGPKGLSLGLAAGTRELAFGDLLDFQGPGRWHPDPDLPWLLLHSGTAIRARILGGDAEGESLQLRGPVLGSRTVSLDDVAEIRIPRKGRLVEDRQLAVDKEDRDKERLFRHAPLGLDLIKGFLFRISEKGIHFAPWHDEEKPKLFPWAEVGALVLPPPDVEDEKEAQPDAGKDARKDKGVVMVLRTRDGSLWRGRPVGFSKGVWHLQTSIGEILIPGQAIVAGHVLAPATRTWLSDLQPIKVTEHGLVTGEAQWKELFGYRRNRNSVGSLLQVGGAIWTQGLGAHSYSRLEYQVPEGRTRFLTQVGIDDSALQADPSGNAAFRIYLDGKKVAEIPSLKGGQGTRSFPVLRVQAGQTLALEIGFADHIYTGDRGNWLGAVFLP